MAMLAEPRQRKRYNLVPKGKALYEDENSFGTKMLEKMGWKKGHGLGAKEDGSKDFVRIRYKNDALGLGFKERDDQWTQHEQSFNGLLKTLNNEDDSTLCKENDKALETENEMPVRVGFGFGFQETNKSKTKLEKLKDKISGISLEERSKQSKARVHYKKFTKGKDLAQYSEKDLANIFGKKAVDEQQHAANNFYQYLNNTFGENRETSRDNGVSLKDNFKIKIESSKGADDSEGHINKKQKKKCRNEETLDLPLDEVDMKSKKIKYCADLEICESYQLENDVQNTETKSKKCDVEEIPELHLDDSGKTENKVENIKKVKKYKKCGVKENAELAVDNSLDDAVERKLKKNKGIVKQENGEIEIINEKEKSIKCVLDENTEFPSDTKSKKKNKPKKEILIDEQNLENDIYTAEKRKFGNSLGEIESSNGAVEASIEIDLTEEPTKKKKSKKNSELIINLDNNYKEITHNTEKQQIEEQNMITKSKSSQETHATSANVLTISKTIKQNSDQPLKKPSKSKNKNVSSNAKNCMTAVNFQVLDLEEIKKQYQAFNIYPISTFCAEKFRNINLNHFTGSILPQLAGYGLNADLQLDVKPNKLDEERITKLWKCALNKYDQLETRKKTYKQYLREAFQVRKTEKKILKLNIKTLRRKNVFQVL